MGNPGVYILQSEKNFRYYIGSTDDIQKRVNQHNQGYAIATKNIRPLILKIFISCQSLREARLAERRLKRYKSRKIIEKVIKDGVFPWKFQVSEL